MALKLVIVRGLHRLTPALTHIALLCHLKARKRTAQDAEPQFLIIQYEYPVS